MIGSVLDKYEVLQKLGEGATATVYRGRHLTIGKDVAIKVLHPHLSASSRYRERFNREARAVGRLSHQNIVSILDYSGQGADDCYIVTELVDGVTITDLLQARGRLPSEIAAMVGADLASALQVAHREGVIHRDIKPDNVMIRRDGRVKLMDFGVARVLDESSITLDGSLLGSPAYMSPQQALDESLDGRSDLFSLGTVLFHAVTGHVPFSGSNASVILRNIIEANRPEVLELAPQASPALAAVIDRLLQPRPEDRYPTAEDARVALLATLDEVRLAPDHPSINLRAFVVDAEGCEDALDAVLRPTLLEVGKERLSHGDTLGALQLFNRLLAIDEDNAEVIALIQSLHQAPEQGRRGRGVVFAALAGATLLAFGGAGWWVWQRSDVAAPRAHVAAADLRPDDESQTDPEPTLPVGVAVVDLAAAATASTSSLPGSSTPGSSAPGSSTPGASTPGSSTRAPSSGSSSPGEPASSPSEGPAGDTRPSPLPVSARPEPTAAGPRTGQPEARPTARTAVQPVSRPAPAPAPAEVILTLNEKIGEAEVWVDGALLGHRISGAPTSTWVGTTDRPLRVPPGKHTIELRNRYSETATQEVTLAEGERRELSLPLRRKKVEFIVNPQIPNHCTLTIGDKRYEPLSVYRSLQLREPEPATPVVFVCPEPLGTIRTRIGETIPGEQYFLPSRIDP